MATGKWIGGILGFITSGPMGALAGFALGALFDAGLDAVNTTDNATGNQRQNGFSSAQQTQREAQEAQRNSFLFSLLVLAAYEIKSDGKVMHSEMEVVRDFLRRNFGEVAVQQGDQILRRIFERQNQMGASAYQSFIVSACQQIGQNMTYAQRLQLLHFMLSIAKADGRVVPEETEALKLMARYLGIDNDDVNSMLNLGENNLESAYKVLGISPNATNDEVKEAYRRMALKHHPDRVAALGEDVQKAAEKKFQEINNAKEKIYKARGM